MRVERVERVSWKIWEEEEEGNFLRQGREESIGWHGMTCIDISLSRLAGLGYLLTLYTVYRFAFECMDGWTGKRCLMED